MIQAKAGRTSEVQVLSSSQSCEYPRQGKLTETCLHILSDTLCLHTLALASKGFSALQMVPTPTPYSSANSGIVAPLP